MPEPEPKTGTSPFDSGWSSFGTEVSGESVDLELGRRPLAYRGFVSFKGGETAPILQPTGERIGTSSPKSMIDSGGLIYQGMPSLEELLRRNKIAYTVLDLGDTNAERRRRRERLWLALVMLALLWGTLVGFSILRDGFWLHPATAAYGVIAIGVLASTLVVDARRGHTG